MFGAAQPPARRYHPDATPTRRGRGDGHRVAALELGTAAEARLCAGCGTLPVLSAGVATDYRRSHARRGAPKILRHLTRAADPSLIAPVRVRQEASPSSSA